MQPDNTNNFRTVPANGIIWLASYPKSGNTWLRFLLHNYLYGETHKTSDVAMKIPDIHLRDTVLSVQKTEPLFCKTHLLLSERHPNIRDTTGFIYILRHPKDVLLSNINYFKMISDVGSFSEQQFARKFIVNMGVRRWIDMGIGSWPEHVNSWLSNPRYPHLVLRYESMLQDPYSSLQKALEFIAVPIDPNKLNRAIYFSSFEKMRALEDAEKRQNEYGTVFSGRRDTAKLGLRFMNKGKTGQTLRHLGEDIEREFNERFKEFLSAYGYE